ncbi:enolase C-terminal domain-like protein [Mycetocola sp. 2940]|uniref:enolase C-terminal domain-like protein n=1 Tax=Mycetocola sp. 2940 TaxID=3156452 RepID=UPI003393F2D3
MSTLISVRSEDIRFPTSLSLDGSDAVNVAPDYSAAYVVIETSAGDCGHGLVFTSGRGNDIMAHAIQSLGQQLLGDDVESVLDDMGGLSRRLTRDSQFRWLGPEKGIIHMAAGALLNAMWDLRAKRENVPLWLLLARMPVDDLVDLIDFSHITDALTPDEARAILQAGQEGRESRIAELLRDGYPAYTTSPGWLGYSDEKLVRLSREAVAEGFGMIKLKVAGDLDDDKRRLALVREAIGDHPVSVDANQKWEIDEAIEWMNELAEYKPFWIEEPISADDVLGHLDVKRGIEPIRVATGELVHSRIAFKQLLKLGAIDVMQIDSTRVAGVNENLANLLLAAKFGVPVCPHAGGVGLCEIVQHLSFFDYAVVSRTQEGRFIEYVDHLHEHFVDPVVIESGRYLAPSKPGFSSEMVASSRAEWSYPDGAGWRGLDPAARTADTRQLAERFSPYQ